MKERPSIGELETLWLSRGIDTTQILTDEAGTILPPSRPDRPDGPRGLPELPLLLAPAAAEGSALTLGSSIGQGGMGVVSSATQIHLMREVAMKRLRPDVDRDRAAAQLMREATTLGALEHPNIVPVHMLGRDDQGSPVLVMKKIAGVRWTEFIREPDHPARAGDTRDILQFHLDVLIQVCNAVSFAHSRRIVHRDLKPDNVMIGPFGEVYVLDWGLAVSIDDEQHPFLASAASINQVAGTPSYMAPEMAAADGAKISERTDVYLLGAMLHHCLTGEPRHQGKEVLAILLKAFRSEPFDYDPTVPPELAAICNRATHADPGRRHAGAEEVRRAIQGYLRHRDSAALALAAAVRLASLRALVDGAAGEEGSQDSLDLRVQKLATECLFGFQQALRAWPDNPEARVGLQGVLEVLAGHHLSRGEHSAASLLLQQMEHPPPGLQRRLEQLRAELDGQQARTRQLERLEHDLDINVGRGTRALVSLVVGVLYTVMPVAAYLAGRLGWFRFDPLWLAGAGVSFVLVGLVGFRLARRPTYSTAINRQIVSAVLILGGVWILLSLGCWSLGIDGNAAVVLLQLVAAVMIGLVAESMDRRLRWVALVYAVGFVAGVQLREHALLVSGATNLCAMVGLAMIWRARPPAEQAGEG